MLKKLIEFLKSLKLRPRAEWCITIGQTSIQFKGSFAMRITNEQQVQVTVKPITAAGKPARIDGVVSYASSDTAVATIDADGLVVAGISGVAQITASFDADLGEGVREIVLSGAVEVVAAEATTGELVFGEPTLQ